MMEILGTQMMGMPQGIRNAEGPHTLPWPSGSVLQARLEPGGEPGSALLIIGGYRLRAEVPPNVPMGEVWLEILGQKMPAQFRIMNQHQAHQLLMEMLRQQVDASTGKGKGREGGDAPTAAHDGAEGGARRGWMRLDGSGLQGLVGADMNRMVVEDEGGGGQARGVIERQGDARRFLLHGRLDLAHLGAVAFALEGGEQEALRLRLFAADEQTAELLRPEFLAWLGRHRRLEGELIAGLPVERGLQRDFVA
ncbi:MAG: hypothetical protein D6682_05195 [Zetaproteobacteria bacterium]|nr:MAG: hypothetical protein D6682_05195 [Zetaproteobacteria bacterium]